jgi:two-component system sensor histidine kinase AlgZ
MAVEDRLLSTVSIRQKAFSDVLPDFRNLGVIARVLVAVNAAAAIGALFAAASPALALDRFVAMAAFVEPLLLVTLVALFGLSPLLQRVSYAAGFAVVLAVVVALAALYQGFVPEVIAEPLPDTWRTLVLSAIIAAAVLGLLRLIAKAYSPAIAEARLQALQARIRPHFLFNSLNAVLSLIRRDPKRAERTL